MMVEHALLRGDLRLRTAPGQGVALSRRNGLMVATFVGIAVAVIGALAAVIAILIGGVRPLVPISAWLLWAVLYLGLGNGLAFGLLAYLQHRRLRHSLDDQRLFPLDAVEFLNFAAERNLLRKVGGGYTFVHALLLDYFNDRP